MIKLLALLCLVFTTAFSLEVSDQTAMEKIIEDYTESWNLYEGKGFAKDYLDASSFINIFGLHFSGKKEIEERHVRILQTFLKDTKLQTVSLELKEQIPQCVIALVRWKLEGGNHPKAKEIKEGFFTHTFVQVEGAWKIAASQNTLIKG